LAEPISTAVASGLGLLAAVWAGYERFKRTRAETGAAVASSSADRAVAESQATVFELMKNRLEALEREMQQVRHELQTERQHSRRLELHIYKLEGILTKAGLEPPKLDETV
jgi:chromosome segregation ATPase